MTPEQSELMTLLSNARKFLEQQRELYGELFLVSQPETLASGTARGKPEEMGKSKKTESSTSETDLFGKPLQEKSQKKHHAGAAGVTHPYPDEPWAGKTTLAELNNEICDCTRCSLGHTRTKFVFGVGNPNADLVLVGEAPGAEEDLQGEPFVGRAGQLLNKILEAINFKREEVYICNILKCRPPNNRDPLPEEVNQCEPYLWKQLELIKPKIVLCLGRVAAQVLLKTNDSLTALRGKIHDYRGIQLMVTYHPAALLRNPHWKRPTWEDVQKLRKVYDEMKSNH